MKFFSIHKKKLIYLTFFLFVFNLLHTSLSFNNRPDSDIRKFTSDAVENLITQNIKKISNKNLSEIYQNCFPNTLDTTVFFNETNKDTFIITGDIEAMWLRDSSFQVFPYINLIENDEKLRKMIYYLLIRQSKSILIDPYANAFNKEEFNSPWQTDETYKLINGKRTPAMNKKIWERKWELDSLISTLFLSEKYMKNSNDFSLLSYNSIWLDSLEKILDVVNKEKRGTEEEDSNGGPEYMFQRNTLEAFDTLHQGRGNPVASCGLIKSMFRNSDDSTLFSYNIPENAFLVSTFKKLSEIFKEYILKIKKNPVRFRVKLNKTKINREEDLLNLTDEINLIQNNLKEKNNFLKFKEKFLFNEKISSKIHPKKSYLKRLEYLMNTMNNLAKNIETNIYKHGVFKDLVTEEEYFAYEVDCFGNHYFIDDPGYPSLMSLPFLGFVDKNNTIYQNTRKRILSNKNPYYIKGLLGDGLSSAHAQRRNMWPLFTIMRGLTSNDEKEIKYCVEQLQKTAESTGFMHESVNIDNPEDFTRKWFSWANSFFGYFINNILEEYPDMLK